jgi:PqqD family protein of HPr-rel-A system
MEEGMAMIRFVDTLSVSKVDDELVLLDSRTGTYFGLNAVGARVFELLSADPSKADAIQVLLGEFDVTEERLRADIDRLLADLKEKGLVETDEA